MDALLDEQKNLKEEKIKNAKRNIQIDNLLFNLSQKISELKKIQMEAEKLKQINTISNYVTIAVVSSVDGCNENYIINYYDYPKKDWPDEMFDKDGLVVKQNFISRLNTESHLWTNVARIAWKVSNKTCNDMV